MGSPPTPWRNRPTATGHQPASNPAERARRAPAQSERQLAERRPGFDSGLLFPSLTGGYRGPESLHKPLRKAAAAAGVPIRVGPLVLRRTFNTLMLQSGVDRIVLRSQMGHCSEQMTERYAGVPVAAKRGAVAEFEQRIASLTSEGCTPNSGR